MQLLEAMDGNKTVVECTFVKSNVTDAAYFATRVHLGPNGVEKIHGLPPLSDFEKKKLEEVCLQTLGSGVPKGRGLLAGTP